MREGERARKMGVCWVGVTGNVYGTGYIIPIDVELSTAADKISTHLQYVVDMVCEEEEERHGSMVRGFCIQQPVSSIIQLRATFLMTNFFNTQPPPHHQCAYHSLVVPLLYVATVMLQYHPRITRPFDTGVIFVESPVTYHTHEHAYNTVWPLCNKSGITGVILHNVCY